MYLFESYQREAQARRRDLKTSGTRAHNYYGSRYKPKAPNSLADLPPGLSYFASSDGDVKDA